MHDIRVIFHTLTGLSLERTKNGKSHVQEAVIPLDIRDFVPQSFRHPFNELFIWAVLNNMQKMALCFWKHGEEAMAKALIACKLYLAMAKYGEKRDLKDDITDTLKMNGE